MPEHAMFGRDTSARLCIFCVSCMLVTVRECIFVPIQACVCACACVCLCMLLWICGCLCVFMLLCAHACLFLCALLFLPVSGCTCLWMTVHACGNFWIPVCAHAFCVPVYDCVYLCMHVPVHA